MTVALHFSLINLSSPFNLAPRWIQETGDLIKIQIHPVKEEGWMGSSLRVLKWCLVMACLFVGKFNNSQVNESHKLMFFLFAVCFVGIFSHRHFGFKFKFKCSIVTESYIVDTSTKTNHPKQMDKSRINTRNLSLNNGQSVWEEIKWLTKVNELCFVYLLFWVFFSLCTWGFKFAQLFGIGNSRKTNYLKINVCEFDTRIRETFLSQHSILIKHKMLNSLQ